ncbi:hypothetical protein POJ06DRAFT_275689 [Lipomyces tetrasporus]|uniref:Uncharacterized protein n=1 Tax=Lipomyces tetrasporus TaxID=54092 RepID=A0AAD7QTC2_9ASCO|nr:uncharacterized protein POJ06DRAFT_275689 [Lipomyces tetrasporus]KAJ8100626.1 hypothetical protein POJ06DRAFT_275689 [Lipomyces tetrasporus]
MLRAFRPSAMAIFRIVIVLVIIVFIFTPPEVHNVFKSTILREDDVGAVPAASGSGVETDVNIGDLFDKGKELAEDNSSTATDPLVVTPSTERGQRTVYLINAPRYHFEVVIPFLHAFSSLPNVDLTLWAGNEGANRWGVRQWLDRYSQPKTLKMRSVDNFSKAAENGAAVPDLIFLTSCPEDIRRLGSTLQVLLDHGAHVMCIIHESRLFNLNIENEEDSPYKNEIKFMRPWIQKGQWQLVTLSQHVQKFVEQNFAEYFQTGTQVTYSPPVLYPVFKLPKEEVQLQTAKPFVTIVGKLEPWRRNYSKIFEQYAQFNPPVDLVLVGNGNRLPAPDSIKDKLIYKSGLEFPQYFAEISKAVLILPSFATEHYVQSQASSSIATAVITVTPPLMTRQMLSAYAYLAEDAVWIQEDDETEVEAFSRIANLGQDKWRAKKVAMADIRQNLVNENMKTFEAALAALDDHVPPRKVTIAQQEVKKASAK